MEKRTESGVNNKMENQLIVTYTWTKNTGGLIPNDIKTLVGDDIRILTSKAGTPPDDVKFRFKNQDHEVDVKTFAGT